VSKDGAAVSASITGSMDLTGDGKWSNVQAIGTSAEQLAFPGDLTTEGIRYLLLLNLDATNYVEVSLDASVASPFLKLAAGEGALLRVYADAPVYYAKANTAGINLQLVACGT
jgi:hypothetical protein